MKLTGLFAPGNDSALTSLGLLLLRLWFGLSMLFLHGWDKIIHFNQMVEMFDPILPIGKAGNVVVVIFAEVVCAALIAAGLVTRFAAAVLTINMAVAFAIAHKMVLTGEKSGEMAFVYLGVYAVLILTGPGRFSADAALFGKKS